MASRSQSDLPESLSAIVGRLRSLRQAYGSQAEFCRIVDITTQSWNNFESGFRRISLDQAIKVCNKTGATLDWIYRGREDALPMSLAKRISEGQRRKTA